MFVSTTILKAQEDNDDVFARLADDMQVKELHALTEYNTRSLSLESFSVKGAFETFALTENSSVDPNKYQRVYNLQETNTHPFNIKYNFDIFVANEDEALSLFQN